MKVRHDDEVPGGVTADQPSPAAAGPGWTEAELEVERAPDPPCVAPVTSSRVGFDGAQVEQAACFRGGVEQHLADPQDPVRLESQAACGVSKPTLSLRSSTVVGTTPRTASRSTAFLTPSR